MSRIEWGPEIKVDGKRPEWLTDGEKVLPQWGGRERALREIAAMETAGANATVKRMAARARKELGE